MVYLFGYRWKVLSIFITFNQAPCEPGVYIIRIKDSREKFIYVGSTQYLAWRLRGQRIVQKIKGMNNISNHVDILFLKTDGVFVARKIEREVIRKAKPMANIHGTNRLHKKFVFDYNSINEVLETDFQ